MIYDYRCLSQGCLKEFQLDFPIGSEVRRGRHKLSRCPYCGTKKVKKVIHKSNIIFKGSGFYASENKK